MRLIRTLAAQLTLVIALTSIAWGQTRTPGVIPGCIYLSTPPTLANKQQSPILCDVNGKLSVTALPGGSTGQVQYNNAGAFGGMAGTSWDNTNRSLTITGATVTTSKPVLDLTQTWNDGAVGFTGLKLNVTNTASASASYLLDLQVGGVSKFQFSKSGILTTDATTGFVISALGIRGTLATAAIQLQNSLTSLTSPAAASWQLGAVDAASPVAQTLRVQGSSGTNIAAAASFKIIGPQATGNAAPGDILLQTGAVGASGAAASVATTALTVKGATQNVEFAAQAVHKGYTVAALPTGVTGGRAYVTDQLTACPVLGGTFTGGGAVACSAFFDGAAWTHQ